MKYQYHTVIVGAGSAGLTAAKLLARFKWKTLIVDNGKFGGDCLNTGCVPSKSFIRQSKTSKEYDAIVKKEVHNVINEIGVHDSPEALRKLGLDVAAGEIVIKSEHEATIDGKAITFKNLIIAIGSRPRIINFPGLQSDMYFTSDSFWDTEHNYEKVAVIGTGAIGLELGQSLAKLNTQITFLDVNPEIMNRFDKDVNDFVVKSFQEQTPDLEFKFSTSIKQLERISDDEIKIFLTREGKDEVLIVNKILLATGRQSNGDKLQSEIDFPKLKNGYYNVNPYTLQITGYKNIYAAGDCNGLELFTHQAGRQAGFIVESFFVPLLKYDSTNITWSVYTNPNIAFTGRSEAKLKSEQAQFKTYTYQLSMNDRCVIEHVHGFMKFYISPNHKILGALLVGEDVSELVPQITIFMKHNISFHEFRRINFAYPSVSEIFRDASVEYYFERVLPPKVRKTLTKIFGKH